MNYFGEIRRSCEKVVENARWIHVNEVEVDLYPEKLLLARSEDGGHTQEHHLLDDSDRTLEYFLILDAINFGSGYFPFLNKEQGVSGYFTVAKRLKEHIGRFGMPTSDELAKIDISTCAKMLGQDLYSLHMEELMQLFAKALRDLGNWSNEQYDGDLLGVLRRSKCANDVIHEMAKMPLFDDRSEYFGTPVFFYKRAQIFLQDVKVALPAHPLIQFDDINELTAFADNILPYVFALDGLIELDPWIEARIGNEELIAWGSAEEIELRACAIYISERISKLLNENGVLLSPRELDFKIWNRGQQLKKTSDRKRHRTRCTFY